MELKEREISCIERDCNNTPNTPKHEHTHIAQTLFGRVINKMLRKGTGKSVHLEMRTILAVFMKMNQAEGNRSVVTITTEEYYESLFVQ